MKPAMPLAEQRRIVAKVDELMAVLDALETALTTAWGGGWTPRIVLARPAAGTRSPAHELREAATEFLR